MARDRYLDLLRAAAILRVITFHMFGFVWLGYALPAMGVMFALGGSLAAASLERSGAARPVIAGRVRRLLPAVWALGAILVPLMLWRGWPGQDLRQLVFWLVPVAAPPGSDWAAGGVEVLWYLVTYLWLVLLSAPAWWAFRRRPVLVVLLPLAVLAVTQLGPWWVTGRIGDVVVNVATFGACWVAGFAHRTGALRRMRLGVLLGLAAVLLAAGAGWAFTHPADGSVELNEIPLAQGLYSLGFVLLALRWTPKLAWLARRRALDGFVTLVNARAVTIYLWHNFCLDLAFPLGDRLHVWALPGPAVQVGYFAVGLALIPVPVLALGWVEDLAARRRPRLLPTGPRTPTGGRRDTGALAGPGRRDPGDDPTVVLPARRAGSRAAAGRATGEWATGERMAGEWERAAGPAEPRVGPGQSWSGQA